MECEQIRAALSARLDHEDPGIDAATLDAHLATCPACRGFLEGAQRTRASMRVAPAPATPDVAPAVMAAIAQRRGGRARRQRRARLVLVATAVTLLAVAVPMLIVGGGSPTQMRFIHHAGSMSVALAAGFLFIATRPSRNEALVPISVAVAVCLMVATAVDVLAASGHGH